MRRPIFAANWKMNKDVSESLAFVADFILKLDANPGVDVVIVPPFPALHAVGEALSGYQIGLGAQNVYSEENGPFTGEVSSTMLASLGCRYAIVGHSERRALFSERDTDVAAKIAALLEQDICPIVCIGESLQEREAGNTLDVVKKQLTGSLATVVSDQAADLIIAYEPLWAIGTDRTATPETAQEVHRVIRDHLRETFGESANTIRIQYGGSVKPENTASLLRQPDIDGALVGGASLEPESFARIVHFDLES